MPLFAGYQHKGCDPVHTEDGWRVYCTCTWCTLAYGSKAEAAAAHVSHVEEIKAVRAILDERWADDYLAEASSG